MDAAKELGYTYTSSKAMLPRRDIYSLTLDPSSAHHSLPVDLSDYLLLHLRIYVRMSDAYAESNNAQSPYVCNKTEEKNTQLHS